MSSWNSLNTKQKDIVKFIKATTSSGVGPGPSQSDIADYLAEIKWPAVRTSAMTQELTLLRRMNVIHWEKGKFRGTVKVCIPVP